MKTIQNLYRVEVSNGGAIQEKTVSKESVIELFKNSYVISANSIMVGNPQLIQENILKAISLLYVSVDPNLKLDKEGCLHLTTALQCSIEIIHKAITEIKNIDDFN